MEAPPPPLTGTATDIMIPIIKKPLKLPKLPVVKLSCLFSNLAYSVISKKENSKQQIIDLIFEQYFGQCGIIYCATQADTPKFAFFLKEIMISSTYYHRDLNKDDKIVNTREWLDGKVDVMCSTSAFGMGTDKKDVRFVSHDHHPPTIEELVQDSGSADRDGQPSDCIIFFKYSDRSFHLRNIAGVENIPENIAAQEKKLVLVNEVCALLSNTKVC